MEVREKFDKTILFLIFLSLLVLIIVLGNYFMFAQIDLNGKTNMVLEYKSDYVEKGFTAKRLNVDISKQVKVTGDVDTNKLGVYEIIYEIDGFFGKRAVRTVSVEDNIKPTLNVKEENIYLCPGDKYKNEDVTASDNYDGDLSSKVIIDSNDKSVTYTVSDSSGNKTKVIRDIVYEDKVVPVITLNGSKYVYGFVGENYIDMDSSASDNCNGDISSKISVSNTVNSNLAGTYEVKYSVSDLSGNTTSVVRNVRISERNKVGAVYLTFDDGPQWGTTDVILDILKEEGVEATFFVTNKGPDELIKRMHDEGHTVAIHTATHNYATVYASVDSYFNDLNNVNERVKRITGEYSKIIRFPGGSSNTVSRRYSAGIMSTLTTEVVNRGYKYYDWNISSGDAAGGSLTADIIKNNVIYSLRSDRFNMVLMHDIKTCTRDALREIIRYGKDNGYTFEKITMDTEMVRQRVNN